MTGFHNCLFTFYSEVSGKDGELFTAIHSLFSFFDGIAILSVGPVGTALLQSQPGVHLNEYALGKYKVCSCHIQFIMPIDMGTQYLVAYTGGLTMASGVLVLVRKQLRNLYS